MHASYFSTAAEDITGIVTRAFMYTPTIIDLMVCRSLLPAFSDHPLSVESMR
jgi:hypothetical protein